ncbi:hypothetical protein [Alteromonas australica]|uniref:hypothetical protein n=1 Tax=Alteromonas australica TaxID=589873 RepID=UPI0024929EBA|nr:hypothetical protein [Alteromonas australica]
MPELTYELNVGITGRTHFFLFLVFFVVLFIFCASIFYLFILTNHKVELYSQIYPYLGMSFAMFLGAVILLLVGYLVLRRPDLEISRTNIFTLSMAGSACILITFINSIEINANGALFNNQNTSDSVRSIVDTTATSTKELKIEEYIRRIEQLETDYAELAENLVESPFVESPHEPSIDPLPGNTPTEPSPVEQNQDDNAQVDYERISSKQLIDEIVLLLESDDKDIELIKSASDALLNKLFKSAFDYRLAELIPSIYQTLKSDDPEQERLINLSKAFEKYLVNAKFSDLIHLRKLYTGAITIYGDEFPQRISDYNQNPNNPEGEADYVQYKLYLAYTQAFPRPIPSFDALESGMKVVVPITTAGVKIFPEQPSTSWFSRFDFSSNIPWDPHSVVMEVVSIDRPKGYKWVQVGDLGIFPSKKT